MRTESIIRNSDFSRAYRRGKSYVSPFLVTYVVRRKSGGVRLGITTSKKIGGAVERVRARRVIREALTQDDPVRIQDLTQQMHASAADLQFEVAARLRDEIAELKKELRQMVEASR